VDYIWNDTVRALALILLMKEKSLTILDNHSCIKIESL
jgi:hypothetical protein